jgi:hypothetical protein
MSEEKRAKLDDEIEEVAQRASDDLKSQIAALRSRVRNAHKTLTEHADRERGKSSKD